MFNTAKKQSQEKIIETEDYEEFKLKIEKGGFFKIPWCGKTTCEEKIKEDTSADIRVIPFGSENKEKKCMYCQEQSEVIAIFARGY